MTGNLLFCETTYSSGIEILNTISCIFYVIIGFYISLKTFRDSNFKQGYIIGLLSIFIGITSTLLHTTQTNWALGLDLYSMILLLTYVIIEFVQKPTRELKFVIYPILFLLFLLSLFTGNSIVLLLIFAVFGMYYVGKEIYLGLPNIERRNFWIGFLSFCIGLIFWIIDYSKVFCSENNFWLNGHAIWHLFTAITILFLYRGLKTK